MSTIKVTPEQLHHVSNQVDQARQQLEHIQDNLSRQIMFLQAVWLGVTQERFYGDFAQSRPVLQKALESMVYTSKELKDIATRFEQADAEKGSLGGVIGAVGAAAMMKSSGSGAGSEDKGYRMAQVNVFGRLVQMPVNEDGVTDQAALQAYQKDQGHLDFNRMQATETEEPGEDIFALQIEAFENRIHPFTGEPVNDRYAQMMVTSLKFSQVLMAFQMVRGSMPGRKGPFRLPSSHPAVVKMKANVANAEKASVNNKIHEVNPSQKFTGSGMKDYDKVAEMEYESIRQTKMHDIKDVAANTGLSVDEIRAMKKHLFFGKHQVPQPGGKEFKMERFIADDEIAYAWKTAQKGELSVEQKSWFKQLADHELVERKLMAQGQKYRTLESWNPITGRYDGFPPGAHENAPKQPRASFPGYEEYFFNKSFK
ncbi:WXG100 family type VII secretion target [Paenibacillus amylolyticus]|uniref:WXG100 family type VII secretion target n=1 Tax=Paenibacillus amylolyticus TaxID=1451 RepID=UPI003EB92B46